MKDMPSTDMKALHRDLFLINVNNLCVVFAEPMGSSGISIQDYRSYIQVDNAQASCLERILGVLLTEEQSTNSSPSTLGIVR